MARVDWITASFNDARVVELLHNHLASYAYSSPHDAPASRDSARIDYRYPALPASLVQYTNDLLVLRVSGARAHDVTLWLVSHADDIMPRSIARIDVQRTVAVSDADDVVLHASSSPRYQRLLLDPRPGRGATLYVGSPRSRGRLRVYNKSAQADLYPSIGEYLRLEYQCRDYVADMIYSGLVAHQEDADGYLLSVLKSRVAVMAPSLFDLLPSSHTDFSIHEERPSPRYGDWLFGTVLPALRRIEVLDSDLYLRFLLALKRDPL